MQPYEKIRRRTPSEVAVSALAPERAPCTDFSLSATPFHFFSRRVYSNISYNTTVTTYKRDVKKRIMIHTKRQTYNRGQATSASLHCHSRPSGARHRRISLWLGHVEIERARKRPGAVSDSLIIGGIVRTPRRELLGARRGSTPAIPGQVGLEELEDGVLGRRQAGLATGRSMWHIHREELDRGRLARLAARC